MLVFSCACSTVPRSEPPPLLLRDLEALRDRTFRRRSDLRLADLRAVRRFVDQVGFAFLYRTCGSELPSVWGAIAARRDPRLPRRIQHHAGVGLAWRAKDVLAERKQIFYGKLLRRSPTLLSLELFEAFYALSGNRGDGDDHLRAARAGRLSPLAARIAGALAAGPPLTTQDLKALSGCAAPGSRPAFDRAMAEVQERLLVVKYAELYEPRFTFVWGPLHLWLPDRVARAGRLDPARAREDILERYLSVRWAAALPEVERLFGWPRAACGAALEGLIARGRAVRWPIEGRRSPGFALPGIDRALRGTRRAGRRASRTSPTP